MMPGEMVLFLQEVCCLGRSVLPTGGVTGGSEQAAQHQGRGKGDSIFSETQQLEEPQPLAAVEKLAVFTPNIKVSAISGEWKGWKLVTSGTKRKASTSPKSLQLQKRLTTLKDEEEPQVP